MTAPAAPAAPAGPAPRNKNLIWVVLIGVVAVLGLVAVVASKNNKDSGSSTAGGTTTTESPSVAPVAVTGVPLPAFDNNPKDKAVGKVVPVVSGRDLQGKRLTIGTPGKAQIILFVAHWCPHCQREVPRIVAHLNTSPLPADVRLETVSTAVNPAADNYPPRAWLEREHWPVPALADSSKSAAAQAYGLPGFPYFVAVDKTGKVVARGSGEITMDGFDTLVKAAQTGQPPA